MRNSVVLVAVLGMLVGCAGGPEGGSTVTTGGLIVHEHGDEVSGTWTHDGVEIEFHARMLTANILDLEIQFDGMTVTYLADFENATAEFDGYATETGEETQMLDTDRALLAALSRELEELGADASMPIVKLRDFANVWAEFPSTLDMQGHPPVEPGYRHRSDRWYEPWNGVQICDHLNSYMSATHDDNNYGRGNDCSTLDAAYVSWHSAGSCSDGTYFHNGSWQCYEPDHTTNIEYGYGNCFGRCGSGCGSSGTFTIQCLDHDECVRTGHDVASLWCNDEFLGTTDDYAFAPNC